MVRLKVCGYSALGLSVVLAVGVLFGVRACVQGHVVCRAMVKGRAYSDARASALFVLAGCSARFYI